MIDKLIFDKNIHLERNVACIGCFDGVHRGHQELLKETVRLAKQKGIIPIVITFDPDPIEVFGKGHLMLTSLEERIKIFEEFGIKEVVILKFDEELMHKSADSFKKDILDKSNIDTLVCGFDFTYAYKGQGNVETLKKDGINLKVIPEFKYYGKKISSSRIRKELLKGDYKFVNRMLGYEYKK